MMIKTLVPAMAAIIGIGMAIPSSASAVSVRDRYLSAHMRRGPTGLRKGRFGSAASKMPPRAGRERARILGWTAPTPDRKDSLTGEASWVSSARLEPRAYPVPRAVVYVYLCTDGIRLQARLEDVAQSQ
jgi:hypothetical protein